MTITKPKLVLRADLAVHTNRGTIEADPVMVHAGQWIEPLVTLDSETGRVSSAELRVYDPAEPVEP